MKLFVVGSGKLANAILSSGLIFPTCEILKWETGYQTLNEKAIVLHAGSGRQLPECIDFCSKNGSVLVELSTGLETENIDPDFTLILCPNTSVLVVKTLQMLKLYGHYFEHDKISILESHQSSKNSEPGTAFSFAKSLQFPVGQIRSVRDPEIQSKQIGIPDEYLDKHAYHKIVIQDGKDELTIETKVLGHEAYINGVKKIVNTILTHRFEKKKYTVLDLIDKDML